MSDFRWKSELRRDYKYHHSHIIIILSFQKCLPPVISEENYTHGKRREANFYDLWKLIKKRVIWVLLPMCKIWWVKVVWWRWRSCPRGGGARNHKVIKAGNTKSWNNNQESFFMFNIFILFMLFAFFNDITFLELSATKWGHRHILCILMEVFQMSWW